MLHLSVTPFIRENAHFRHLVRKIYLLLAHMLHIYIYMSLSNHQYVFICYTFQFGLVWELFHFITSSPPLLFHIGLVATLCFIIVQKCLIHGGTRYFMGRVVACHFHLMPNYCKSQTEVHAIICLGKKHGYYLPCLLESINTYTAHTMPTLGTCHYHYQLQ